MSFNLTSRQAIALRVLDWLYSNEDADRRSGRSTVVALAYIAEAIRRYDTYRSNNPYLFVSDHYMGPHGALSDGTSLDRYLLDCICSIIEEKGSNAERIFQGRRSGFRLSYISYQLRDYIESQMRRAEFVFPPRDEHLMVLRNEPPIEKPLEPQSRWKKL